MPDSVELFRILLSAMYVHTGNNVLSATMAHLLLSQKNRFTFSHDFITLNLPHLIKWCQDDNDSSLNFRLRTVVTEDGERMKVMDKFINDLIYRPIETTELCIYQQLMEYEKVKIPKEKKDNDSKTILHLCEEHPSAKYIGLCKRSCPFIPLITSTKLLPNIKDLLQEKKDCDDEHILNLRETYAQIALLLFLPFRTKEELQFEGLYWKKYQQAISNDKIWEKDLEILQNIQDVNLNCANAPDFPDHIENTHQPNRRFF